jgi:hypothetical protein
MDRRQAESIRDLARGEFLALGPAITRRPVSIRIGAVRTLAKSASPKLVPLPDAPAGDLHDLLFATQGEDPVPIAPEPLPVADLLQSISAPALAPVPDAPALEPEEEQAVISTVLAEMAAERASQPRASLYQDFLVRCRMRGAVPKFDLAEFARRFALALAGIEEDEQWEPVLALASSLPEEMLAPFLLLARSARDGAEGPSDAELAALYGTASAGRVRRMLDHIEAKGLIVCRTDLSGKRTIGFPHLGWTTAAAQPDPSRPSRMARIAAREPRSSAR